MEDLFLVILEQNMTEEEAALVRAVEFFGSFRLLGSSYRSTRYEVERSGFGDVITIKAKRVNVAMRG